MKYMTIDYIKAHSRLDEIRAEEENIIELYATSAEDTTLNYLNRTIEDIYENYGEIPAPIMHATLFLVDHFYAQRTPASPQNLYTVPYTFDFIIKPFMIL